MAKEKTKNPAEVNVEEKLKNLYALQTTLTQIDKVKTLRGELPREVQDLEDEIEGLTTRIEKIGKDLAVWKDAKPYMGFFYDDYLQIPRFDAKFDKAVIVDVLNRFLNSYDPADDSSLWFEKAPSKSPPTKKPDTIISLNRLLNAALNYSAQK